MKYLFFLSTLLLYSCTKTDTIIFHGRLSYECNDQAIRPAMISISRIYDNGTTYGDLVGNGVSDVNGNFSFTSDVKQKGKLEYYSVTVQPVDNSTPFQISISNFEVHDLDADVVINKQFNSLHAYRFHIKNVNPFDSSDRFEYIALASDSLGSQQLHRNLYLTGTTVDTTVIYWYGSKDPFLAFSFTKSGATIEDATNQIHDSGCMDTVNVDMFY